MNKQLHQFGVYDPITKIFYTLPVSSQEEFNHFLSTFGLLENSNQCKMIQNQTTFELFNDFDSVVEEVKKTPLGLSSQILMEFDF